MELKFIQDSTKYVVDGATTNCYHIDNPEVLSWVALGNTIAPADPVIIPIPSISPRQIRQALTHANLRASVEATVLAGDQDLKDWWEFAVLPVSI